MTALSQMISEGGAGPIKATVLTGTGTHTFDPRTKVARIFMIGGGGGGRGGSASLNGQGDGGAGGAAGEILVKLINASEFGPTVSYACGAGGVGSAGATFTGSSGSASALAGSAGGDTTFGSLKVMGGLSASLMRGYCGSSEFVGANSARWWGPQFGIYFSQPTPTDTDVNSDHLTDRYGASGGAGHGSQANGNALEGGKGGSVLGSIAKGGPGSKTIAKPEAGQAGISAKPLSFIPGGGGGGGGVGSPGLNLNAQAGDGGNGGFGGGGGGGGGGATAYNNNGGNALTATGGKGGNGGDGVIAVLEYA